MEPQPNTNGAFNTPRVLPVKPPLLSECAKTVTCDGAVSCYRGNGPVLTFRITNDMWRAFRANHLEDSHVRAEWLGDNSWKLFHDNTAHARFYPYNAARTMYTLQQKDQTTFAQLGHFYTTPCEYALVDGVLMATLKEAARQAPVAPAIVAAAANRKRAAATAKPSVAPVSTETTQLALASLLEAVRRVEATTSYRLVKLKEDNIWAFKLNVPTIIR